MKNLSYLYCDAPEFWQIGTQDPATFIMEGMIHFYNYLVFYMILIGFFVCALLCQIIFFFRENIHPKAEKFTHSSLLEIIWTIIPAMLLMLIAIPSFTLLYSLDELIDPNLTLKIIGHQWYWSYEYSDYTAFLKQNTITFDSYMINAKDLNSGAFRLLEVDNRVILPEKKHIRLLITSADVLHSWAVPSFGIKIDACPGRLSQISLFLNRKGVFYGQCSEICGINHGFMPIVIKCVSKQTFKTWIYAKLDLIPNKTQKEDIGTFNNIIRTILSIISFIPGLRG